MFPVRRAVLIAIFLFVAAGSLPAPGLAETGRAALVVRYADGRLETRCVSFSEPAITGEQLLARSGLVASIDYAAGLGGAVCSIGGQGCEYPKRDCFCRCTGATCEYWAYYLLAGQSWQYSQQGASSILVRDGDVQAWSWGPGNFASGTEPPPVTFAAVCSTAATAASAGLAGLPATGLSQYAAFAVIAGLLMAVGVVVMRRRR